MKINSRVRDVQNLDISEIYGSLKEMHDEVFMLNSCGRTFLYKQLGRKDYKDLIQSEDFSVFEKEEIVCEVCTLWPNDFDFKECEAGIPTELSKAILRNSFLDDIESKQTLIDVFREEMYEIDNQVTCLIHEAFPEFPISEIEEWDMQMTAKYLSRSEWILVNLRGATFNHDPFTGRTLEELEELEKLREVTDDQVENKTKIKTEELGGFVSGETVEQRQTRLKDGAKKEKLTPQKLMELQEKYPEMKWGNNVLDDISINDFSDRVSGESPALRPGF